MGCHVPHVHCTYPVALSGMGSVLESSPPASGRDGFERPARSRIRQHPACRRSIPFHSAPFRSYRRPVARSGGTLIRAYPARACAGAGARIAAARFARLIARARPRATPERKAHLSCQLHKGFFSRRRERRNEAAPRLPLPSSRSILSRTPRCQVIITNYFINNRTIRSHPLRRRGPSPRPDPVGNPSPRASFGGMSSSGTPSF